MPGRNLEGNVKPRGASWTVSLPLVKGQPKRTTKSFQFKEDANRWREAALAALEVGKELPDPDDFRQSAEQRKPRPTARSFSDVAWAWYQDMLENSEAQAGRHQQVEFYIERHLIPFFAPRVCEIEDVTREMCVDFLRQLAGMNSVHDTTSSTPRPIPARNFTIQEIANMSGVHRSTVRRAFADGKFPKAVRDTRQRGVQGTILVPAADVLAAGFGPQEKSAEIPFGHSRAHAGGILATLRRILGYARSQKLMSHDPTDGLKARKPAPGTRTKKPENKQKPRLFSLQESKGVAAQMHIHHQLVMWIIRLMGLRISEAFGLHVDDVHRVEGTMLLHIHRQGGKKFVIYDENRKREVVPEVEILKTDASNRVIPVPRQLAELIELYIAAFRPDPDQASLPLIVATLGGGGSAFRRALKLALAANQLSFKDVGFTANSHHLRKCVSTEIGWTSGIKEPLRSKYLGHRLRGFDGGAEVTARDYTLEMPRIAELLPITSALEGLVARDIATLIDPTPAVQLFPSGYATRPTDFEVPVAVFNEAGLLCDLEVEGDPVLTIAEAAELMMLTPNYVSQLSRSGRLKRAPLPTTHGVPTTGILQSSIFEVSPVSTEGGDKDGLYRASVLHKELGVNWQQLQRIARHAGVTPIRREGKIGDWYDAEMIDNVRSQFELEKVLTARASTEADVARALGVTSRTAGRFMNNGQLEIDSEATEVFGKPHITLESLERLIAKRNATRQKTRNSAVHLVGFMPIEQVMEQLGKTRVEVLGLSGSGVRLKRTADYRFYVEEASLEEYLREAGVG